MKTFVVRDDRIKFYACEAVKDIQPSEDDPLTVVIKPVTRTLDQNAKLWPMLEDIAKQVKWHGVLLKKENWKHIFSAAIMGQDSVPGLDGELVVCGYSTSQMGKKKFSEMIELMYSFGAEHNVRWSDEAKAVRGLRD